MWHIPTDDVPSSVQTVAVRNHCVLQLVDYAEAYTLLELFKMNERAPICEHCKELYDGRAYRVTSEEDGILLLDMIVCYSCSIEARRLGLDTRKHDVRHIAFN
jgi:superfamily II helicase